MKFMLTGKVASRTAHKVKKSDGTSYDIYNLEIVEPGIYPSHFQVGTKDPTMLGQADGPFGIGREVVCYGFINGKKRVVEGVKGKFTKYDTYLTLTKIESAEAAQQAGTAQAGVAQAAKDEIADDIPF